MREATNRQGRVWAAAFVLALALAACARNDGAPAADYAESSAGNAAPAAPGYAGGDDGAARGLVGQANAPGSFLAYEHHATIRADADEIAGRVAAVREACMSHRHGSCVVLGEDQQSGEAASGTLRMRAEPKAIEPLVGAAAAGAELAQRSTSAEDLADAVRDNGLRRKRLETQHARLSEFIARPDIAAADLITLSGQLAAIEAELQYAEQESAQQQRRIGTNLLTLEFRTNGITVESSEIREALRSSVDLLDVSVATLIRIAVVLLPFAVMGFVAFLLIRGWIRRQRRAPTAKPVPPSA